ncbi:unnamed protein product [Gordionus sp. m RMFG-2023]
MATNFKTLIHSTLSNKNLIIYLCPLNRRMLALGNQFLTYADVRKTLNDYENNVYTNFFIYKCEKLKEPSPLVYRKLYFSCVEGKKQKSASKGIRKRRTMKHDCPSKIIFTHKKEPYPLLEITLINENHNHVLDPIVFRERPKQRKLNEEEKKMVTASLLLDGNTNIALIRNDLNSSEQESIHKIMMNDKKKSFNKIEMDSSEYLYEKLLTTAGFEKIETQLILSKTTKLTNYISANYYDCTCGYKSRLQIPCEHILKLRKVSDIPLFDEKLVGQRWHKEYNIQPYLKNEFIFDNNKNIDKILDDFIPPISETSQKVSTQRKTFKQSKMIADQIEKDIFPTLPNPTFNEDFEIQRS